QGLSGCRTAPVDGWLMGRLADVALCAAAYSSGTRKGRHPPCISARLPSGRTQVSKDAQRWRAVPLDEADDDQKDDRTNHGINDRADEARERHESQLREQPDADESADDADDDVPDQSETKTTNDLPGQPAGDRADDDHDDNAVYSNHDILP